MQDCGKLGGNYVRVPRQIALQGTEDSATRTALFEVPPGLPPGFLRCCLVASSVLGNCSNSCAEARHHLVC